MTLFRSLFFIAIVFLVSSCSLLEIKLDSQTTPLTTQELNIRLLSRDYSITFFKTIEEAADEIAQANLDDNTQYSYTLLWKIHSEEGLQQSVYQASPLASLIDSWVFTYQMNDYFTTGAGKNIFLEQQYIATTASQKLVKDADALAFNLLKKADYVTAQKFVAQFSQQHPFENLAFNRTPAFKDWLTFNGIDESEAVATLGTMPEALSDLSDRLSLMSNQTPKLLAWKAELVARNSRVNGEQLSQTLSNINNTSLKFQEFIDNNPEYMRLLASEMGKELQPLLNDFDKKAGEKLAVITQERIALEIMVERERIAIGQMVTKERANITTDLDGIAQNVVKKAIEQLTVMLSDILIYLILFVLVIFFAPFGLGFIVGRKTHKTKA